MLYLSALLMAASFLLSLAGCSKKKSGKGPVGGGRRERSARTKKTAPTAADSKSKLGAPPPPLKSVAVQAEAPAGNGGPAMDKSPDDDVNEKTAVDEDDGGYEQCGEMDSEDLKKFL